MEEVVRFSAALCVLVLTACGSGAGNETVSSELAALDGNWTLVEGSLMNDVAIDAGRRTITIGDERGEIRRYQVSAGLEPDGSTLLTLSHEAGERLRWRIALVGDHGKVRMASADEELKPGYAPEGPEIFRDRVAAQQLAAERRRREVNRGALMGW